MPKWKSPQCSCHNFENQVCDICQGVREIPNQKPMDARQRANELQKQAFELWTLNKPKELYDLITAELETFAEEKVKAALSSQKCKDCGCTYEGCTCNPVREMNVRLDEREACAKVADKYCVNGDACGRQHDCRACKAAKSIRSRGKA